MRVEPYADGDNCAACVKAGRRFRVKAATQDAHERLESIVRSAGMFDSLQGYRNYLWATFEARARVEQELDASAAHRVLPTWPRRRMATLIAEDLADLGAGHDTKTHHRPGHRTLRLQPAPELLGRLYVLEGSALGARILARAADALGLSAVFGARHLHAQAGDTAAWRVFCDVLDAASLSESEDERLVAAAVETFDRFAEAYVRRSP